MSLIIDNGKPDIQLGEQEMFGRTVEVYELDEPTYHYHPPSKTVHVMYFGVIDINFTGRKCVWLWGGYLTN